MPVTGADALCRVVEEAGIDCVFGLPGTQTVGLYDSLRRSRLRAIVATHELGAAFMAQGYARAGNRPGVLLTIPGPGFAYALAGLAEARLDGAAVVHLTLEPARGPTGAPAFQALDQATIAGALTKATFRAKDRATLPAVIGEALYASRDADPGPVYVEMCESALSGEGDTGPLFTPPRAANTTSRVPEALAKLASARRPLLFIARDCSGASGLLAAVAENKRVPVCVPAAYRGLLAEDHAWCVCVDDQRTRLATIQSVIAQSDLVVVVGTRLNHVATAGFRLSIPPEQTVCIAPRGEALPHGYHATLTSEAEPAEFLEQLMGAAPAWASEWNADDMRVLQERFAAERPGMPPDPVIDGGEPQRFFSAVRDALPRDAIVVTDSGLHQVMVRRYLPVLANAGLMLPCDLQSMGFALGAGIGAKLAAPARAVLVVMGDGGFAMSGLELLTAVRERIPVVVMVLNDGQLNLIRLQQLREFGAAHGVELEGPDFEAFAGAVGARYRRVSGDVGTVLREAFSYGGPTLVEVAAGDSMTIRRIHAKAAVRETVRRAIGPRLVAFIKARLR